MSGSCDRTGEEMTTLENAPSKARQVDWCPASHEVSGSLGGGARGVERLDEYARLRESCPVAWAEDWGGYWTLTRYDDVAAAALNDAALRVGRAFIQIPDISETSPIIPIGINPPEHTFFRRALNRYFAAGRMAELEPNYREVVNRCLDPILEFGSAEMLREFCGPIAARALASLLNLSDDAWRNLVSQLSEMERLRSEVVDGKSPSSGGAENRFFEALAGAVRVLVADRRARPLDPETDLISGILQLEVDGEPLDDVAITGIGVTIFGAGHQTVRDAIGSALYMLATNPGDQARLRREPSLISSAIEEYLRLDGPTQENVRRAAVDLELHGRMIEAGEYVALNFSAANRDEAHFPHPDACIIDRSPNRHLAFGHGRHKCVGAPLARLELRVIVEEVLRRTRSFELDGVPEPGTASQHGGFATLPLRFKGA